MEDKYPAHKAVKEALLSYPQEILQGVSDEFTALLQRQQSDEGLIRELVEALEKVGEDVGHTLACGAIYIGLEDSPDIIKAGVQKAKLRLKELS